MDLQQGLYLILTAARKIASGEYSVATNYNNTASGRYSFVSGENNTVSGEASAAFGVNNDVTGDWSMAIGRGVYASGNRSLAQGVASSANSDYSVALNFATTTNGLFSLATGRQTTTTGANSISAGEQTQTYGTNSVAMGYFTKSYDYGSLVIGAFNLSGSTVTADRYNFNVANTAFVIGNGASINARSDAFKVMFNGNTTIGNNLILSSYGSGTKTGTATQKLAVDTNGNVIEIPIGSGPVDGSGTANYAARWIDTDTLGIGVLYDNGTNVGIGVTSTSEKLDVQGNIKLRGTNNLTIGSTSNGGNFSLSSGIRGFNFANNNGDLVRIDGSGNVGIGTTNPTAKLEIAGSGNQKLLVNRTDGDNFYIDAQNGQIRLRGSNNIYMGVSGDLLTVTNTNVGIGTTSPSELLHVQGNNATIQTVESGGATVKMRSGSVGRFGTYSNNDLVLVSNSGDRMIISSSGNVGIGTTSPSGPLHVKSSTNSNIVYIDTSANALGDNAYINFNGSRAQVGWIDTAITLTDGGGNKDIKLKVNTGSIFLMTSNTARMFVNSSGDVGIGTTSPNRKLHIVGSGNTVAAKIEATDGSQTSLDLQNNEGWFRLINDGGSLSVYDQADSVERFRINTSGNVGIGATNPQAKLDISTTGTGDSMIIRNNDASSSAAPVLMLLRDSASAADGDYLGQIKFKGNSDTGAERVYAKITAKISDATNGAEDSLIETAVRDNGSNLIVSRQTHQNLKLINGTGLESDGDIYIPTVGKGLIIKSPDGTRYRITVDNSGNLGTELA